PVARVMRRSMLETAVVSLESTIAAIGVARATTWLLALLTPVDVPQLASVGVTAPAVLAVMGLTATVVCLVCGMWPALFVWHIDAVRTLLGSARTAMHPRERALQRFIVGSQMTVAVVLLSGAVLFIRSVRNLDRTAIGFSPDGLLSMEVEPSTSDVT